MFDKGEPHDGWPDSARRKGNQAMKLKDRLMREAEYDRGIEEYRSEFDVLTVEANDTYLRARLEAWIDCIRDEWECVDTLGTDGA